MAQAALKISILYFIISFLDPYILSWQTLNRPIVIAPLAGLILGDFQTGIIMGAGLESIFMGISAIGGQVPADATTASLIAVSFTVLTGASQEAGIALSLPIGTAMAAMNQFATPISASMAPYWEKIAHEPKKFLLHNFIYSAVILLIPTVTLYLAVAFGVEGLNSFLASLPVWVMNGLNVASGMMLAVGFAMLTSMIFSKQTGYFFILGFVLVKYLELDTLAIAIIGGVIAITMFMYDKKLIELGTRGIIKETADTEEDFF